MAKRDYLVEAAKQIRMALDREVNEDYEAAFSYYKNGVDLLLNGVQLDPNKDRREAVKRKTTQYLKRAEEIFISHLQDNLGKGSSHLGGYSSLRFRPIRHLSSPVEDLEMCKVVGVVDKVLIVQSMVNKETFVVKSLAKSSWESRDQPTIIPQGVPYMVKLLRYYVSEDAVYLHLEHVQGGRLFSKLHKVRSDRAKQHRESLGPVIQQHGTKLKNSHTSPTVGADYQHNDHRGSSAAASLPATESDDGRDAESTTSWYETQQRLESCGTHAYIEETGCLQNTRSAASFYARLERPTSLSDPTRTHVNPRLHPPAPSLCLQSKLGTQEKPALPLACARVSHALDVMSEFHKKTAGMGLIECSSEFEVAWKTADPAQNSKTINPYAVSDADLNRTQGHTAPHTNKAGSTSVENTGTSPGSQTSSSPAVLQIPFHCQTQMHGKAPWIANGPLEGPVLSDTTSYAGNTADQSRVESQITCSPTADERNAIPVIKSTDRAVFSECTDTDGSHSSSAPGCHSAAGGKHGARPGISLDLSGATFPVEARSKEPGEEVEEAWELLSPGGKSGPTAREGPLGADPYPSHPPGAPPQRRRGDMDAFLKSEGQEEDHIIEVDGWCYLPRFPAKSPGADEKAAQVGWGTPEAEARIWGAQILLALESLHQQGVLCRDLNPKNVLLTSNGKVCLSFFGQWSEVQSEISPRAMEQMYCAPEIGGVSKITEACDWWSLGALLFELLTGMPLWQLHPAGIHSHTQLFIPDHLSPAAASLLTELLQFDAGYRLGSGGGGVSDIKCHPFFSCVSWKALSC